MLDAVVISDLHLGSPVCQTGRLERFLRELPETRRLILNGDVLDDEEARLRGDHWRVLSALRDLSDRAELVWVRGNHDGRSGILAKLIGARYAESYLFNSGEHDWLLCVHGDAWDDFIAVRPVMTFAAEWAYRGLQVFCKRLAVRAKLSSKTFLCCAEKVKAGALTHAAQAKVNSVLCGHVHHAERHFPREGRPGYYNSGCWTDEDCHYLAVEDGKVTLHKYEPEEPKA